MKPTPTNNKNKSSGRGDKKDLPRVYPQNSQQPRTSSFSSSICISCQQSPELSQDQICLEFSPSPHNPTLCMICGHLRQHHTQQKMAPFSIASSVCVSCLEDSQLQTKCAMFERGSTRDSNPALCRFCGHTKDTHKTLDPTFSAVFNWRDQIVLNHICQLANENQQQNQLIRQLQNENQEQRQHIQQLQCEVQKLNNTITQLFGIFESTTRIEFNSKITNDRNDFNLLVSWTKANKMSLLYRASRDGFRAKDFHDQCDGKGATLTLIKDQNGNIFGGFTKIPWSSFSSAQASGHCLSKPDFGAFLFTLKNNQSIPPQAFHIRKDQKNNAVDHDPDYGPIFGNGSDLCIANEANLNKKSFTNPDSYENPTGTEYPLTTNNHFCVSDYEVFLIE